MATDAGIPDFPFFRASDPEVAFGCGQERYLSRAEGKRVSRLLPKETEAFSALFFTGGKLSDHGLRWKPECKDGGFVTLAALMKSFGPSHEAKEGTVALALHHWCEPIPADAEAA